MLIGKTPSSRDVLYTARDVSKVEPTISRIIENAIVEPIETITGSKYLLFQEFEVVL